MIDRQTDRRTKKVQPNFTSSSLTKRRQSIDNEFIHNRCLICKFLGKMKDIFYLFDINSLEEKNKEKNYYCMIFFKSIDPTLNNKIFYSFHLIKKRNIYRTKIDKITSVISLIKKNEAVVFFSSYHGNN